MYIPVYFYWFWLSLKARSFFFFSTSNPSIENAGFIMEKKKDIYDIMPKSFYPKTAFATCNINETQLQQVFQQNNFTFPIIAKPNIGERGNGVKKLETNQDLFAYSKESKVDFLLQEWIDYKNEAGIFYYRYPNEKKGKISGIVSKEFLQVVGDGISTTEELLIKNTRFILQLKTLQNTYGSDLQKILNKDETLVLVPYGNHCRGSKFIDASNVINEKLEAALDNICQQIPAFYFGRMDIKFNSWEDLANEKNFSIIELNGAGSEPTHIYDPKHSIFFAWKEIMRHLTILYKISIANKAKYNLQFMTLEQGLNMFKLKKQYNKIVEN